MAWTRTKLEHVVGERLAKRSKLEPVERAALAYARWQGLTDEADVDTAAAKRALDAALVALDSRPDGWLGLKALADDLGDGVIIGLMQHSLKRGVEQVRELSAGITPPAAEETGSPPEAAPVSKRQRKRDRGR